MSDERQLEVDIIGSRGILALKVCMDSYVCMERTPCRRRGLGSEVAVLLRARLDEQVTSLSL